MRPPEATAPARPQDMPARQAAVAIGLGLILIVLTAVAIRFTEMVHGQYISTAVPPLPAFAALLTLSVLRPLLLRHAPRFAPTRAQILLIYAMMTVAVILSGLYHIRAFLPHLVALQYWGSKEHLLTGYARYLPGWYAPHNAKAIQDYYEGTRSGAIPWGVWLAPLFFWSLFFLAMFIGVFSMVNLVQRQWIRNEKVSFPLLTIPLALTANDWSSFGPRKSRRALFLGGFAVAAAFSTVNILHAVLPSVPAPGFQIPLIPTTLSRPWTPLQPINIYFMLETIGIGYFVPLEVSFSAWFFYAFDRLFAVAGTAAGYDAPGFPFTADQCAGGYIAIGLLLLVGLRRPLAESLRRSFRGEMRGPDDRAERLAWVGLVASTLFILGFCYVAGLSLKLAAPFFLVIGLFVLVYARIRAETGAPFQIIYPVNGSKDLVLNTMGIPAAVSSGGVRAFTLFYSLAWLTTHHHPHEEAAYQMDSIKLAQEGRISRRTLFIALLLAFVIGLGAAYWVHLSTYYKEGSNLIPSAGEIGEWREKVAHQQYQEMATRVADLPPRSMPRLVATASGFGFAAALTLLRQRWIGCPFHPLGYLLATASGDTSTNWFPMLIAWACKFTILRFGGLRLYRQGMPFFLGLAIGHLLIAGIIWPGITLSLTKEAANSYHLLFGE